MVQTWIIRSDMPPMLATRQNVDDAICGDCKFRGRDGFGRTCYVAPWLAPNNVYKKLPTYREVTRAELSLVMFRQHVRIGAYGDPAAVPFDVWKAVVSSAAGWTGYTHQWRSCDQRLSAYLMASVDSPSEKGEAEAAGWRTFRVRNAADPLISNEVICPASDEAAHRTVCQDCQLCRGASNRARSVAIIAHGRRATFFRSSVEAAHATAR